MVVGIQDNLVATLRASLKEKERKMNVNGSIPVTAPYPVNTQPASLNGNGSTAKLVLEPNVPQQIALRFATGKIVESQYGDKQQVLYSLADGRQAYVSLGVSQSIINLGLRDHEPFNICKRWNGERGQKPRFDVWLTPDGEKRRAVVEMATAPAPAPIRMMPAVAPADPAPPAHPTPQTPTHPSLQLEPWEAKLLKQTTGLIDVYALACEHAAEQGVPPAIVRTMMISAFIGLQRKGGA